jgi:hypothetical protein
MHYAHRYVASLFLAAAFAGPMAIMAAPTPQGAAVQVRVYDRNHRDYHNWDGRENNAWGVYLTTNHRPYYEYARANRRAGSLLELASQPSGWKIAKSSHPRG